MTERQVNGPLYHETVMSCSAGEHGGGGVGWVDKESIIGGEGLLLSLHKISNHWLQQFQAHKDLWKYTNFPFFKDRDKGLGH